MPNYQNVSTRMWQDPRFRGWSDRGKLLATYLLTCHHRATEGLYFLPRPYMAADLGWTVDEVIDALDEIDTFALYDSDAQVVLILKALRYQTPTGTKQVKGARNRLEGVPATWLWPKFLELAEEHASELYAELTETPIPHQPTDPEYPTDTQSEGYRPSYSNSNSPSDSEDLGGDAAITTFEVEGWEHPFPVSTKGVTLTSAIEDWARTSGIEPPDREGSHERVQWLLRVTDDVLGTGKHSHGVRVGLLGDWAADVCGQPLGVAAWGHLKRLVKLNEPADVLRAVRSAAAAGAGLGEQYRDDPLALTKYVAAILGREEAA